MMVICPDSFWSLVLLLVIIIVSVAVIVVVVVVVVAVMVIVVVVSLVVFPFPFIAFPNSCSPTPELIVRQFTGHWTPIQDTSELGCGFDYCKLRCHLLSESKSKVLVLILMRFHFLAVSVVHHSFHVALRDLISISKSQSLNISVLPG
ncbi:hypothetical protein Tco_1212171 [Tanacetum coccineum]